LQQPKHILALGQQAYIGWGDMKNWFIPVAVVGLSGLGIMVASERGREKLRYAFDRLVEHGDPLGEFNNFLDDQLTSIQRALDNLAAALEDGEQA
jgi:hypothetical protein